MCLHSVSEPYSFKKMPSGSWNKIFYIYTYPIRLLLFCTIPDPQSYPKLFPLTFIMCVIWIGTNSYLVSWMITLIGRYTFIKYKDEKYLSGRNTPNRNMCYVRYFRIYFIVFPSSYIDSCQKKISSASSVILPPYLLCFDITTVLRRLQYSGFYSILALM